MIPAGTQFFLLMGAFWWERTGDPILAGKVDLSSPERGVATSTL